MAGAVLHLSTRDIEGGAARAAYALHTGLVRMGLESRMRVGKKTSFDPRIVQGSSRRFKRAQFLDRALWKLQRSPVSTWRSPARFGSLSAAEINASSASVVNLHWITDGLLNVEEIGKINKPMIWSMYDMWPFSGTEHYGPETPDARWASGYSKSNRSNLDKGFDLDLWAYMRKKKCWSSIRNRTIMIPASSWLENAIRTSDLMSTWAVKRVPHLIDTNAFAPKDLASSRRSLGIQTNSPIVLFLTSAGLSDHRKGWDLLATSLNRVADRFPEAEVDIAGPLPSDSERIRLARSMPLGIRWLGVLAGNTALRLAYNSASVVAVPSRQDTLPLSAMEAQSCGTPVVAFNIGGLSDVVVAGESGFLVEPFDTDAFGDRLCDAIAYSHSLGVGARRITQETYSTEIVSSRYVSILSDLLSS